MEDIISENFPIINIQEELNKKEINHNLKKIFFISSFNKKFFSKIKKFQSKTNENSIETYNLNLDFFNENFEYKIHSFVFDKNQPFPKKLELEILLNDETKFILKDLSINNETLFIFQKLEFKSEQEFIQYTKTNEELKDILENNYQYTMKLDELLIVYIKFFENQNENDIGINSNEYFKYLINNYLKLLKKSKNLEEERDFNYIISFFLICYKNENIIPFLDIFKKFKFVYKIYNY